MGLSNIKVLNEIFLENENNKDFLLRAMVVWNKIITSFLISGADNIYEHYINVILDEMDSRNGSISIVKKNGDVIVTPSFLNLSEQICKVINLDENNNIIIPKNIIENLKFWGKVYNQKVSVYDNSGNYCLPEGHLPLSNILISPILFKKELIGMIGISNKDNDYDIFDVTLLEMIIKYIAPILKYEIDKNGGCV